VPTIAVGTISWTPEKQGWNIPLPGDRLVGPVSTANGQKEIVQQCVRNGLDFFDTAERYSVGRGESLLAEASIGTGAMICSKFTPTPWRTTADSVVEACRASCERLGSQSIDLYQIHMPDIVQPGRWFGYENKKDRTYWEGLCVARTIGA